ncbi:MAG: hypothetical protein GZ091_06355 [Paludibacter sp.]|nr:hypothetical protein [Paludibacter sp.]
MDSFGDYIYLIILAVAGLSGLLKKKKTDSSSTAPSTTKRSWQDVLRELTPVEEETQEIYEEPITKVEPVKVEPVTIMSYETTDDSSKLRAKRNASQITSSNKSYSDQKKVVLAIQPVNEYSINSPEEARRAFIYSEIFNRKY